MRASDLGELTCPIARTVAAVGDAWSLMIIRELYLGSRRFDEIEAQLRTPPAALAKRLKTLEDLAVIGKRPYQASPKRYEYRLTRKGLDLWPLMIALKHWGDRWGGWKSGAPAALRHKSCHGHTGLTLTCDCCGEPLTPFDVELEQKPPMASERKRLQALHLERNRQKQRLHRKAI